MRKFLENSKYLKSNFIKTNTRAYTSYADEYRRSIESPEEFWSSKLNLIEWFKKPEKILVKNAPFDKWYVKGLVNASFNCLDIHVERGFGSQTAIIYDSPMTNKIEKINYRDLLDEVKAH